MYWVEGQEYVYRCTNCETAISAETLNGLLVEAKMDYCPSCGDPYEGDHDRHIND